MALRAAGTSGLNLIQPPYDRLEPRDRLPQPGLVPRGSAVVWWLVDGDRQAGEFNVLRERPFDLPLIVILPAPREIHRTLPLLRVLRSLRPRSVLPGLALGTPQAMARTLVTPPSALVDAVLLNLLDRRLLTHGPVASDIRRIFQLAPSVTSISGLARRLYTSRRTLGRRFSLSGLPVPSHWLQFARLLIVSSHLQTDPSAIFRIASRAGYPDGFTLSNQMKRLIGCRPTEVRVCLGWEWILESWIRRERSAGAFRNTG